MPTCMSTDVWLYTLTTCQQFVVSACQVADAANALIQDDTKLGTVLLVLAKHGPMEWVPAKQNLRPVKLAAGSLLSLLFHPEHLP